MPTNRKGYLKQYANRLKIRALGVFGNRCVSCFSSVNLEFAHRKRNGFHGSGRGKINRMINILTHIDNYILLCSDCHKEFDLKYNGELKI